MFAWPRIIYIIQVNSWLSILARGMNLDIIVRDESMSVAQEYEGLQSEPVYFMHHNQQPVYCERRR